jgi:nucleotide-binding universal stress UspA family protein
MTDKIVVGVDGSPGSILALRWAADEARLRGAVLEVVTAWHYPVLSTIPAFGVLPPADEMTAEARKGLHELLEDEKLTADEGLTMIETVREGSPAGALVDAATDADLLVVGSRGQGSFGKKILGSVSHACVTHAECPVVVVPSSDEDDS